MKQSEWLRGMMGDIVVVAKLLKTHIRVNGNKGTVPHELEYWFQVEMWTLLYYWLTVDYGGGCTLLRKFKVYNIHVEKFGQHDTCVRFSFWQHPSKHFQWKKLQGIPPVINF